MRYLLAHAAAGRTAADPIWPGRALMRAEGVSFRHAVELLRDGMPAISPAGRAAKRSTVRRLASPLDRSVADDGLLDR